MTDIIKSKGWDWKIVSDESADTWRTPSVESFYLVNRWKNQNKKEFLDLGCGLGRHSILFAKNGFDVKSFDISETAIERSKQWANEEKLNIDFKVGDMLSLPYKNETFDCILCRNAISHTDTNGMKQIVSEINRVLKHRGECFLTLGSKDTWGFKQNWPMVDENTKLNMQEGSEYEVPHFYADYDIIQEIFKNFKIELIQHVGDFFEEFGGDTECYHYHLLINKI